MRTIRVSRNLLIGFFWLIALAVSERAELQAQEREKLHEPAELK